MILIPQLDSSLVLENLNEFEESDGMLIEFTPDEEFKDILDKGLTQDQKTRLDEIKKALYVYKAFFVYNK